MSPLIAGSRGFTFPPSQRNRNWSKGVLIFTGIAIGVTGASIGTLLVSIGVFLESIGIFIGVVVFVGEKLKSNKLITNKQTPKEICGESCGIASATGTDISEFKDLSNNWDNSSSFWNINWSFASCLAISANLMQWSEYQLQINNKEGIIKLHKVRKFGSEKSLFHLMFDISCFFCFCEKNLFSLIMNFGKRYKSLKLKILYDLFFHKYNFIQ